LNAFLSFPPYQSPVFTPCYSFLFLHLLFIFLLLFLFALFHLSYSFPSSFYYCVPLYFSSVIHRFPFISFLYLFSVLTRFVGRSQMKHALLLLLVIEL
jgi:hypothetical protein